MDAGLLMLRAASISTSTAMGGESASPGHRQKLMKHSSRSIAMEMV